MRPLALDISLADIVAIHDEVQGRLEARPGLRHRGTLDYIHREAGRLRNPLEQAAALAHGLLTRRPFTEANAATAFVAADVILGLKGYRLEVEPEEAEDFIAAAQDPMVESGPILDWIQDHAQPRVRQA